VLGRYSPVVACQARVSPVESRRGPTGPRSFWYVLSWGGLETATGQELGHDPATKGVAIPMSDIDMYVRNHNHGGSVP
jgi:hypothetical protein